jgi:hypothetical protein
MINQGHADDASLIKEQAELVVYASAVRRAHLIHHNTATQGLRP